MNLFWQKTIADEQGSEVLQFVGMVPFLILFLVLAMQLFLFGVTAVSATGAAHNAARSAAIAGCHAAESAAQTASDRWPADQRTTTCECRLACVVTVELQMPIVLHGIPQEWIPATAVLRSEPEG